MNQIPTPAELRANPTVHQYAKILGISLDRAIAAIIYQHFIMKEDQ